MEAGRWFAAGALASLSAVAVALVSQHVYGLQPCPWCILQRVIFLVIAVVCLLGLLGRSPAWRRLGAGAAALLALGGMAAALWQHFQAAASASCSMTFADKVVSGWLGLDTLWPDVFSARASCAEAAVSLLGVPYDFYSLALFAVLAAVFVGLAMSSMRQ